MAKVHHHHHHHSSSNARSSSSSSSSSSFLWCGVPFSVLIILILIAGIVELILVETEYTTPQEQQLQYQGHQHHQERQVLQLESQNNKEEVSDSENKQQQEESKLLRSSTGERSANRMSSSSPVFSLFVTLEFTSDEYLQQFLTDLKPVAEYARDNEPGTISYEVLRSDKDPLRVLLMERYKDKEVAYLQVHKSSKPFLEYRPKLKAMEEAGQVTIVGESYVDTGVGFGDRVPP